METDYVTIDVDVIQITKLSVWMMNLKDRQVKMSVGLIELSHEGEKDFETDTTPYRAKLPEYMAIELELV